MNKFLEKQADKVLERSLEHEAKKLKIEQNKYFKNGFENEPSHIRLLKLKNEKLNRKK
jgi:hypothetical protein